MIAERVAAVRERLSRAAARAARRPEEVTLVAVSKTFPAEAVQQAFAAGLRHFGENKVQEGEAKALALQELRPQGLCWHLVGHLQANKAKQAATVFDVIHSIDGPELASRLDRLASQAGRTLKGLAQVDLAGESTKHGVESSQLMRALEQMRGLSSLSIVGLMVLPPFELELEAVRPFFRRLRELRDEALTRGLLGGSELSMGMSHDFEVAIEEGATLVRVGTALFGERQRAA